MAKIEVKGDIIPNGYKWMYDLLKWESTCPNDLKKVIESAQPGEEVIIYVNSPGGDVQAGQEMYSLLAGVNSVAEIQGFAASAAGLVAMGCKKVKCSPVGIIMIHNVQCGGVEGDYHEMEKASEMLKTLNEAISNAYAKKSGRPLEEILDLMDKETWITANQAMEYGFVDEIISSEPMFTNSFSGLRLTTEMMNQLATEKAKADSDEETKNKLLEDLDFYGI